MRLLMTNLLATAVLLLGAANASAVSISFNPGGPIGPVAASDTVVFDVVLDLDIIGLELLGVNVLFNEAELTWLPGASSQPTYMLYSAATAAQPSVYMIPNPPVTSPLPGQVLISWRVADVLGPGNFATGNGLVLATLAFHVTGSGSAQLDLLGPGAIFRVNGVNNPGLVNLGGPLVITPEPTTALLVALGLVGLGVAGRRRS